MIRNFEEYINEGVKDKMTPKSEEEIMNSLKGLNPYEQMYKAIEYDMFAVVKYLIENGIDLNKNVGGGTTAGYRFLTKAVEYGKLNILKYLLDNGCDFGNLLNYHLRESIEKGHYDIAYFLFYEYGATVSDDEGENYLQIAVDHNNLDLVKLVVDHLGCEYFERDWLNDTILGQNIDSEIIKYLIKKIPEVKKFVNDTYKSYELGLEILKDYVQKS